MPASLRVRWSRRAWARARIAGVVVVLALELASCRDEGPTDEDLVERFVKDVTGPVDAAYVARALTYVDMARFPIDVRVPRQSGVYGEERSQELITAFKRIMERRFYGTEIKLRSERHTIEGDRAEIDLGLMTAVGPLSASITLRKASPGVFKVARVHVEP